MHKLLTGLGLIMLLTFCNDKGGSGVKVSVKLLNNTPYKGLTDSIDQFPDDATLYERRAILLSQNNQHALASADYEKAWKLAPSETTALLYASSLFIEGRQSETVDLLTSSVKTYPDNPELRRRLSEAYVQSGQPQKALAQYNAILENDSSNFEAWYEKASILAQSKDTTQAIRALERAYSLQPMQLYGVSLANLYAETRDNRTLALCDDILARDSLKEGGDAYFIKGVYYSNTGQLRMALDQFENCINRDWKFTDAYIEKGIILFNDKNIDEALKTFALASRVSNRSPDAYYWKGRCYESIGNLSEARDNYFRAYILDRGFKEAKDAMDRIDKKQK